MTGVPAAPFGPWTALAGLAAGALLGALHFGGLWWTLDRMAGRGRPHRWLALSFAARTLAVLAGFGLLVGLGGWWPPLVGLAGFLGVRQILVRRWGLRAGTGEPEEG